MTRRCNGTLYKFLNGRAVMRMTKIHEITHCHMTSCQKWIRRSHGGSDPQFPRWSVAARGTTRRVPDCSDPPKLQQSLNPREIERERDVREHIDAVLKFIRVEEMSGIYRLDTQTACVFLNKHSQCVFVWVSPLQRYLPVFPSADVDGTRASLSLETSQTLQINKIKSLIHSILHLSIKCVCVCVC